MAAAIRGFDRSIAPPWTAELELGSLISVISLSEMRYEGFLIEFTSYPYTIGLRNVRFLGTEGREKYKRQTPPSDKIYEYVYLRGNNIKDLRVISAPSAETKLLVPEDPAIIGPRVAQPTPTTMASTLISHGAAQGANVSASAQSIFPGTSFQFNQSRDPSASTSSVQRSLLPPLPANSSRLAVPNYLHALTGSSGKMPHFQLQLPPPPPSLVASQAPVQQKVQRQNVNTSAVGGSRFYERHPPLLLRRSTTSSNAVPPLVSTPSVQPNPEQPSPSQSLKITDTDAKTALAPVMESLPSGSTEETPGALLKLPAETGSTPSHQEKGQSSQGKEQKPRVKRGFKEDFNFEAMYKKFNKKQVWDYFSKIYKGEARGVKDTSKPVYEENFFDFLSYGAPDYELAKVTTSAEKDEETFGAEIPIIPEHRGPRKMEWRPRIK